MDKLSVLFSNAGILTKTWKSDGEIKNFSGGKFFKVREVSISNIDGFGKFLEKYQLNKKACVVRGKFVGSNKDNSVRSSSGNDGEVTFIDQHLHLFCIDIDEYSPTFYDPVLEPAMAIGEFVDEHLPIEFRGVSYVWQLSSSAGHIKNKGILKAHVWFWSATAQTSAQMRAWAINRPAVDNSLFQEVQVHYTATPIFEGIADPVPVRFGIVKHESDEVLLKLSPSELSEVNVSGAKVEKLKTALENDDTAVFLLENGWVKSTAKDGKLLITCPFADEHTGGTSLTATIYYPANTGGYARGHFDCKHAHCDGRSDSAYRYKLGMTDGFDDDAEEGWAEKIENCKDTGSLEILVNGGISTDKALGVVDRSKLEALIKNRFKSLGAPLPLVEVRKLMTPKHTNCLPDVGESGSPLETIDNIRTVCNNENITVRYNVIKKETEVVIPESKWSIDNAKVASISWLRSECHKVEIRTNNLVNFVTLIADENQYNPVSTWITSKPWDGTSRIPAFYASVKENNIECTEELKKTVMLRWAISAIMGAFSPTGVNARGVLVFQGAQYLGKTRWIETLAPKHLDLVKTGKSLNVHDKDSVKQIVSAWIAELGELDATFKKSDIAALKAFITQDTDELRRPYAVAESVFARRTVFAASVNEDKFLHDPTGNTRFWVIPVVAIDHEHGLDMQQVWAEFYELWKKGEKHYLTNDEMAKLNAHNESFTAPDPIFEMVQTHLDWKNFNPSNCKWLTASDILRWIGKKDPTKHEAILAGKAVLSLNGGNRKKSHGLNLRAVPRERLGIEINSFDNISTKNEHGAIDDIPF